MKMIVDVFRKLFPFLFITSVLKPLTNSEEIAFHGVNPFPQGRYQFHGRTNGASRKKKSNRLRLSKMTRNKHR